MIANNQMGVSPGSKAAAMPDYLAILYRNRWLIVVVFTVVIFSAVGVTMIMEPVYESTASLLIDTRQSSSALFQDPRYLGTANIMQNELEILQSYTLRTIVAENLIREPYLDSLTQTVYPLIAPPEDDTTGAITASAEAVADRLLQVVSFEVMRESDVIKIYVSSTNPKEAADIANAIARAYYERNVMMSRSRSRAFREFLEKQVAEKQQNLTEKESSLREYMEAKGVVSLDDESKLIIDQLSSLQAARDANEIEIESLLRSFADYQKQSSEAEIQLGRILTSGTNPYIEGLQEEIARLEIQRDITLAQNPSAVSSDLYQQRLVQIEKQIGDLRAKLKERTTEFLADLLPSGDDLSSRDDPSGYLRQMKQKTIETQTQIRSLQAKRKVLNESIHEYERKFASIPAKSIQYAQLERDRSSLEKLYLTLDEKYNEANIQEKSEFGYVDIFDRASVPTEPSSPNLILNVLVAIVLGGCLGVVVAFVREYSDQRAYSPEDLQRKGYFVLSTIPSSKVFRKVRARNQGHGSNTANGRSRLAALQEPLSVVSESYRHLRNSIRYSQRGSVCSVIAVTSPEPGDGKTTVVANLGVAIAQTGKEVIVVDADLREPTLHEVFRCEMKPGLAQVLRGSVMLDEAIQSTEQEGLHILTAGSVIINPAEEVSSPEMKFLIDQLKSRYEIVLFDCPPALAVTDAAGFSTLVEGVVVVLAAGRTTMSYLRRTHETLEQVGANLLGVVLNHFDMRRAYGLLHRNSAFGYYGEAQKYGRKVVEENVDSEPQKNEVS